MGANVPSLQLNDQFLAALGFKQEDGIYYLKSQAEDRNIKILACKERHELRLNERGKLAIKNMF